MQTQEIFTIEERRAEFEVVGLGECDLGDLSHLTQCIGRIFVGDNIRFGHFLLSAIDREVRSRIDGSVEAGSMFLAIDAMSDKQLTDFCFATCFLRRLSGLSKAELSFVENLHQRLQLGLAVRLSCAKNAPAKMLDRSDIADLLGITDEQVHPLVERGLLPLPVRLNRKTLRWRAQDVYEAIHNL